MARTTDPAQLFARYWKYVLAFFDIKKKKKEKESKGEIKLGNFSRAIHVRNVTTVSSDMFYPLLGLFREILRKNRFITVEKEEGTGARFFARTPEMLSSQRVLSWNRVQLRTCFYYEKHSILVRNVSSFSRKEVNVLINRFPFNERAKPWKTDSIIKLQILFFFLPSWNIKYQISVRYTRKILYKVSFGMHVRLRNIRKIFVIRCFYYANLSTQNFYYYTIA